MNKLSGLVLDHVDDIDGEVLRSIFPDYQAVPDLVKQAHSLSADERRALPSDVFALELVDGDVVMRKFACCDAGNTALSVEYFMRTGSKLPEEAQKLAAENLVTACGWYDIEPPEVLTKVALGVGSLLALTTAPSIMKGTKEQVDRNMAVAKASGGVVNPAMGSRGSVR